MCGTEFSWVFFHADCLTHEKRENSLEIYQPYGTAKFKIYLLFQDIGEPCVHLRVHKTDPVTKETTPIKMSLSGDKFRLLLRGYFILIKTVKILVNFSVTVVCWYYVLIRTRVTVV